jgi:FSR family fosmidomycin resistance protein-like MFS transporter
MTQAVELPLQSARASETKLVASVCVAHFVSHYYILLLAPLFIFVREDFGVSYTELGLALTMFNVVSAVLQPPAGFLVDRVGARIVLIVGLLLGAGAFAVAGLVHSFWLFVAMFAVAGLGNTVYHPADYALLSQQVPLERAGTAFSFHNFSGMLGNAAAPVSLLFLQTLVGWRGAFLFAALLGVVAALILIVQREPHPEAAKRKAKTESAEAPVQSRQLLLSPPILLNLVFFVLLAVVGGGLNNYLVVALGALHGTSVTVANAALTALLCMSAIGVLVGGVIAGRTGRHGLVTGGGLLVVGLTAVLVGVADLGTVLLVLLLSVSGFFGGIATPSRDMIVRAVTPPGAYGRVFGFVTTGFNIGGIVSPLIFGQLMDHGHPRGIFFVIAVCALLSIATVAFGRSSARPASGSGIGATP